MEREKRVTATNMGSCPAAAACGAVAGFLNKLMISINMQLRQVSTATRCVAIGFLIAQRYGKRGSSQSQRTLKIKQHYRRGSSARLQK